MRWDSRLGIWGLLDSRWLKIRGTTPRNAEMWVVDVETGKLIFILAVEYRLRYVCVDVWWGEKVFVDWIIGEHRKHKKFPAMYHYLCSCQNKMKLKKGRKNL